MHSLPEPALAELEEHLLVCSRCQEQLRETEGYVRAMRDAAARLEQEEESRKRWWTRVSGALTFRRLAWAMTGVALVLVAVALRVSFRPARAPQPFALLLETSRGSEVPHAPAGRPIELSLDITGLPPFSAYSVQVVDETGRLESETHVAGAQPRVTTSLSDRLRPGNYFIRLYSPSRELLREYGLRID